MCPDWTQKKIGGGGGIRTHGTIAGTTVFETAPIGRSGTPPLGTAEFSATVWAAQSV